MRAPSFLGLSCGHVNGIFMYKGRNFVFRNEDTASDCEDEDSDAMMMAMTRMRRNLRRTDTVFL